MCHERIPREVQLHSFLTSASHGDEWLASRSDRFTLREEPRHQLYKRLRVAQSRSGRFKEEKKKILTHIALITCQVTWLMLEVPGVYFNVPRAYLTYCRTIQRGGGVDEK
jgi:hypothetical protein